MRKLPSPNEDAEQVYQLCISRVKSRALKRRLNSIAADIQAAATNFRAAGNSKTFFRIRPSNSVRGIVSGEEMAAIYDLRMARKGSPGRAIYDRLMGVVPHMRCPLCGQRTVSTLDHYLPKARHPELVVTPLNLIPACADCNKGKLARVAQTADAQTLHPYFDDTERGTWLFADVIEVSPAVLKFSAIPAAEFSAIDRARIQHHFLTFGLGPLYTSHAAEEIANIRFALGKIHASAGVAGVRAHLENEAESRSHVHRNSWQLAMYRALAASDWYCQTGFEL